MLKNNAKIFLFLFVLLSNIAIFADTLADIPTNPQITKYFPKTLKYIKNPTATGFPAKANAFRGPQETIAAVGTAPGDLSYAEAQNRIYKDVSVNKLPPGIYTFVLSADGKSRFGQAVNIWEIGTKHLHLGLDIPNIVSAGEIKVNPDNSAEVRLASGTYMANVAGPDQKTILESTENYLQSQVPNSFKIIKGESSATFIPSDSLPTKTELKNLCDVNSAFRQVAAPRIRENRQRYCEKEEIKEYIK